MKIMAHGRGYIDFKDRKINGKFSVTELFGTQYGYGPTERGFGIT